MFVPGVVEAMAFAQNQMGELRTNNIANTLNTNSNASGRNTPMVAIQPENLVLMDQGGSVMQTLQDGTVGTLRREMHGHEPIVLHAVGTDCYNGAITGDVAATMGTPGSSVNASGPTIMQPHGVAFTYSGYSNQPAWITGDRTDCLASSGHSDGSHQGIGVITNSTSFHPTQDPIPSEDGKCHAIGCGSKTGCATAAVAYVKSTKHMAVAVQDVRGLDKKQNGCGWNDDGSSYTVDATATQGVSYHATRRDGVRVNVGVSPTVEAQWGTGGNNVPNVINKTPPMVVRRLTPEECESLQGFIRGWTNIPYKKKQESPDSPRYKAIGNSMACNVMSWIGERIDAIDKCVHLAEEAS